MDNLSANQKIEGKTYTLTGDIPGNSSLYYSAVLKIVDDLLVQYSEQLNLLKEIRELSRNTKLIKIVKGEEKHSLYSREILDLLHPFTSKVDNHLQELSIYKKLRDRTLATTERQYHLYMLEIELINRICMDDFLDSEFKIAFLPYCLYDTTKKCLSKMSGFDYVCQKCSKNCYLNKVTSLLNNYNIEAYISINTDQKKLITTLKTKGKTGVFGVACIAELAMGMRKMQKIGVPVIGVPLNANRCRRWMGECQPNSIDLVQIESNLI